MCKNLHFTLDFLLIPYYHINDIDCKEYVNSMKKSLKVIALFCALSMTLFGFSACQKEESDPSSTTSGASSTESTAKEKLTVGTNSEFPPFEYQENGPGGRH